MDTPVLGSYGSMGGGRTQEVEAEKPSECRDGEGGRGSRAENIDGRYAGTEDAACKEGEAGTEERDCKAGDAGMEEADCKTKDAGTEEADCKTKDAGTEEADCKTKDAGTEEADCKTKDAGTEEADCKTKDAGTEEAACKAGEAGTEEADCKTRDAGTEEADCKTRVNKSEETISVLVNMGTEEVSDRTWETGTNTGCRKVPLPGEISSNLPVDDIKPNKCQRQSVCLDSAEELSNPTPLGSCCLESNKKDCLEDGPPENSKEFVMMCDYIATEDNQLSLSAGDRVHLLTVSTPDWWWVEHNGSYGYVPSTHLCETAELDDPWQDEEYYGSYDTLKLHLEMLSDLPRTNTYREIVRRNSAALCGKHILDLGCGTGIISFFCAKMAKPGAVYAVEASEIAQQTRKLVEQNGFSDIVHVIEQRAEELELPTKVDILVSEWMGTCLLFEFMLESVLMARDRWLKEDGVMWPSTASIHLVPCSAAKEYANKILFWDSLYQLDFSPLKSLAVKEFLSKPKPDYVLQPADCVSEPCILFNIDMKTVQIAELERLSSNFTFHVEKDNLLHGFTAWFGVQFKDLEDKEWLELSTGPFNQLTHWKHTLFMLDDPIHVKKGDRINGSALFQRNAVWRRHMSVTLSWNVTSAGNDIPHKVGHKKFPMWR